MKQQQQHQHQQQQQQQQIVTYSQPHIRSI